MVRFGIGKQLTMCFSSALSLLVPLDVSLSGLLIHRIPVQKNRSYPSLGWLALFAYTKFPSVNRIYVEHAVFESTSSHDLYNRMVASLHSIEGNQQTTALIKQESRHLDKQGVGRHTGWILMLQDLSLLKKSSEISTCGNILTWSGHTYTISKYSECSAKLEEVFDLNALANPLDYIPAILMHRLSFHTYFMLALQLGYLFSKNTSWRISQGLHYRFLWGPRFILCVYSPENMCVDNVSLKDFSAAFPDEGDKLSILSEQDKLMAPLLLDLRYQKDCKYLTCDLCLFADKGLTAHFANEAAVRAWANTLPRDILSKKVMDYILLYGFAPCPAVVINELLDMYPAGAASQATRKRNACSSGDIA